MKQLLQKAKLLKLHVRRYALAIRKLGWTGARCYRAFARECCLAETTIFVPAINRQICLRSGPADTGVFEKIFIWGSYDQISVNSPALIVDLGANIGLSSTYFAVRFPSAIIIAVEPEANNFKRLCLNTDGLSNLHRIQCAVGPFPGRARLENPNDRADSYRFSLAPSGVIDVLTVPQIVSEYGCGARPIDILKVDIEGAEEALLSAENADWIQSVRLLVVEYHDSELKSRFINRMISAGFSCTECGEDIVCHNLQLL